MILWDTSALAHGFDSREPGFGRVHNLLERGEAQGGSLLLRAELLGLVFRRYGARGDRFRREADAFWKPFTLIPADEKQAVLSERLIGKHGLRGSDAVILAGALTLAAETGRGRARFVSADREQRKAAEREGLRVIALGA